MVVCLCVAVCLSSGMVIAPGRSIPRMTKLFEVVHVPTLKVIGTICWAIASFMRPTTLPSSTILTASWSLSTAAGLHVL